MPQPYAPQPAIEFRGVTKSFSHGSGRRLLMLQLFRQLAGHWKQSAENPFYALRDISFSIDPGESLALIGHNGAGKSTLLSLATRVAEPDEGEVIVRGRLSSVLDLGAGFHPDLTGYENLTLNASLIGFSREQIAACTPAVIEFCGLGKFLEDPIRTYSSGMVMRLAFAIAVELDPDVIVIDEMIAVGDDEFQQKCLLRIRGLRERGKTILLASHNLPTILEFCDHALWLDHGKVKMQGQAHQVVKAYKSRASM
ncbi:MAG: ABC transporter ATP-binding protein [Acidobacteria bacterium]|nr:ABC transporter ATP-binding protein [Acidobacteriota bacterium]